MANGSLMKFNSVFFTSMLALGISQIAIGAGIEAEKPEKPERWFEVEVILFKQLGNKAELKEQFPDGINASNLPNYRHSYDLLTSYLQPSLTRIKQFIPLCGEIDEQHQFLESLQNVRSPLLDEMELLDQEAMFIMPDFTQTFAQESVQTLTNESIINENIADKNITDQINIEANTTKIEISQELLENINEESKYLLQQPSIVTSNFDFDLQEKVLAQPIFSTKNLCIISKNEMEHLFDKEQLANIDLDSFGIDSLPSRLNASGVHNSNTPYLIADESLLLKDISQRLRWSKEFKPLLHFGWRQVGITQKKAIPLKLIAGEHIEYKYQQALSDYQTEIEEAKAIEENLFKQLTIGQKSPQDSSQTLNLKHNNDEASLLNDNLVDELTDNSNIMSVSNKLKIKTEHKQRALNELFSRIKFINDDSVVNNTVSNIVSNIDKQSLEKILSINEDKVIVDEQMLAMGTPPKKPLQPWLLDGFIKIHLDHYLYINADFNVFNQNQVNTLIDNDESSNVKLINFSQNRRVITGEIHYFDHPYIGMMVQIRRFDPTKPADEAVSQAIR